jgi:hypothetical protein
MKKRNNKRKGSAVQDKVKTVGGAYKQKAFGKFSVWRTFKEWLVLRNEDGTFRDKGASKAYTPKYSENTSKPQSKGKAKKKNTDNPGQLKDTVLEKVLKNNSQEQTTETKKTPEEKTDGLGKQASKFIKSGLGLLSEITAGRTSFIGDRDRANPRGGADRDLKEAIQTIRQLQLDYGETVVRELFKTHNIALMSGVNRNKLLKETLRLLKKYYPEVFKGDTPIRSMEEVRKRFEEEIKDNTFDEAVLRLLGKSKRIKGFISPLKWETIPENSKFTRPYKTSEDFDKKVEDKISTFRKMVKDGIYDYELVSRDSEMKSAINTYLSELNTRIEENIEKTVEMLYFKAINSEPKKDKDGNLVPVESKEEIRERVERASENLINYVSGLNSNFEEFKGRLVLGNNFLIPLEVLRKLPPVELLQFYEQIKYEVATENTSSTLRFLSMDLELQEVLDYGGKRLDEKSRYELHHVEQFASFDKDGNPYVSIERTQKNTKKGEVVEEKLKAVSREDFDNVEVVRNEDGSISHFVKQYYDLDAKGNLVKKGETIMAELPLSYYEKGGEILEKDGFISGFRDKETQEEVSWRKAIDEMTHTYQTYLDIPNIIHQSKGENPMSSLLHPVDQFLITPENESLRAKLSRTKELSERLGLDPSIGGKIDNGLKNGVMGTGKGAIESSVHDKFRDELTKVRKMQLLDTLSKAVDELKGKLPPEDFDRLDAEGIYTYYNGVVLAEQNLQLGSLSGKIRIMESTIEKIKEFSDSATIKKMEDSLAKLKETYSKGILSRDNLEASLEVTRGKIQDELNLRKISGGFLLKIIKNPELWGLPPDATKKQVLNAIVGEIRNRKGLDNFPSFNDDMELIKND